MAANTDPIFIRTPQIGQGGAVLGPTANTALDGTGTAITSIFQADATEGSWVQRVILKAVGSPATTVARIYLCSDTGAFTAGTTNTAANTTMIAELTLPTVTQSQVAASPQQEIPLQLPVPAGMRLLITFGTSTGAAGTGYAVTVVAGRY